MNEKTNKLYHVNVCPVKNYFIGSGHNNFVAVNNALLELKEEEEQVIEQRKSKKCLIILLSSKNLSDNCICLHHCHF